MPATTVPAAPTTTVAPTTTTPPPPPEQAGWTVEAETPIVIQADTRTVDEADGSHVTVARFRAGTFRLDLHAGSTDPPSAGVPLPADGENAVAAVERPLLLGAFNGGFKTSSGSGGVEIAGHVLSPLITGRASVVIDADGRPSIGTWGSDVPAQGTQVASVRQNLQLLVEGGQPAPSAGVPSAWGVTLGGGVAVARSAVGTDALGDLIYAGSISARPADLADALVAAGAVTGMEMDINPEWVQLDLASTPGGTLTAAVPGQNRPASQYLAGWSRDFFTVVAAP